MTKPSINLQDSFLNQMRKENVPVTIFLVNGYQLKGVLRGFDNFTLILEADGKQQLVYKHAISTVAPFRPVELNLLEEITE
ncbi:MAG TPA: RNA chaperone Hfq [Firmicutes bacterium]|nr:RNA chaperone Hfq [Bacillota bacterium]